METIKEKLYNLKVSMIVFYENITRVIHYLPVIWKMKDFDHDCCLTLYKRSLERLEPVLRNGHSANGTKYAKRVRIMINLIDRITNSWDAYEEFRYNKLVKQYGEVDIFLLEKGSEERYKARKKNMQEERYLANQDLKMLTDMIYKWHKHLWD